MNKYFYIIIFLFYAGQQLYGQSYNDSLIVFVGKKISVSGIPHPTYSMDFIFEAKYLVEKVVFGNYNKDTIEFTVADHYGLPEFSKYEHVLLFVSHYKGKLWHEKYQFFDVYKTKSGEWAGCGDPYKLDDYHRKDIKPGHMNFKKKVVFEIPQYLTVEQMASFTMSPYYKIINQGKSENA